MLKNAVFGNSEGRNYAVNIKNLPDGNDYFNRPFGRRLPSVKVVGEFMSSPGVKTMHIGAKGIPTMKAVKKWVKDNNPIEFYACWPEDSSNYKDDSVLIYFSYDCR